MHKCFGKYELVNKKCLKCGDAIECDKRKACFSIQFNGSMLECIGCMVSTECEDEKEKTTKKILPGSSALKAVCNNPEQAPKNDDIENKPDLSLLPMDLLEELVKAYEFGMKKGYPMNSWRTGFKMQRNVAASRRHCKDFWDGKEIFDKQAEEEYDMKVYHCAMVIFNQLCILDTLKNHPEFIDDRFKKEKEDENK